MVRSTNAHLPEFPMIVNMRYIHNHPINCADALKHRDVSDEVKETFLKLFKAGHTPSSALEIHKYDMQTEDQDDFVFNSADRAKIPDLQWCYRLYYSTAQKAYGGCNVNMLENLESLIERLNLEHGETVIKMNVTIDNQLIVAMCTPLMKRVLQMVEQSGEMIFMDSSGNMDRHNLRVFLLMTHSCCGGLPIGCLITTTESQNTIKAALDLYKSFLPDGAFYGRGCLGPQVFMTDDSDAERGALQEAFPESSLLLCVFHVLQAAWRWLWDAKSQVPLKHRQQLFSHIKYMMYADTKASLESKFQAILTDELACAYPSYLAYVKKSYDRRNLWAICYRENMPTRGNHTNNYCEAAVRVLKEKVLFRMKAFNTLQLVDFIMTRMESLYARRLIGVANNRMDMARHSKYLPDCKTINFDSISQIAPKLYSVPSEREKDKYYCVDVDMGLCTCHVGMNGGPCKHQAAVVKRFKVETLNMVPVNSPERRLVFYKIATGKDNVSLEWFSSLTQSVPLNEEQQGDSLGTESDVIPLENPPITTPAAIHARDATVESHILDSDSEVQQVNDNLRAFRDLLMNKVKHDPVTFLPAVKDFLVSSHNLRTDSALISALHTFGKYSGAGSVINRKHKSRLAGLKHIGVQPTAVARRKKAALGGRKCVTSGRPTKRSFVVEHGYTKAAFKRKATVDLKCGLLPPKQKFAAPHNLSECVNTNQSLGKTHSKQ
ncbi:unnamed protein product [Knipowitschia caucasica]